MMAKSKRSTGRKAKTTKRTRPTKPELVAALDDLTSATARAERARKAHGGAVDTMRVLFGARGAGDLSDAFLWTLDSVYKTRGELADAAKDVGAKMDTLGALILTRRSQSPTREGANNG